MRFKTSQSTPKSRRTPSSAHHEATATHPGLRSAPSPAWGRASRRRSRLPTRSRGFSLIEFLAVLALMAIVAGIVTVSVRPLMLKGKQNAARAEVSNICNALEAYFGIYGRYPSNEDGLAVLRRKGEKISEPLLTQDPIDPWGHSYQYNAPGREGPYEVICFGADGREGGSGDAVDIVSWNLKDAAKP